MGQREKLSAVDGGSRLRGRDRGHISLAVEPILADRSQGEDHRGMVSGASGLWLARERVYADLHDETWLVKRAAGRVSCKSRERS